MERARRLSAILALAASCQISYALACPVSGGDTGPRITASLPSAVSAGSGTFSGSIDIENNVADHWLSSIGITLARSSASDATLIVPSMSGVIATTIGSSSAGENVLEAGAHVTSYRLWFTSGVYIANGSSWPLTITGDAGSAAGSAYVTAQATFTACVSDTVSSDSMSITGQ